MAEVKLLKYVNGTLKEHETSDQLTFNSFTGNGSGLTSLNASNISSGVLAKARTDLTMASSSILWTAGVLSVIPKTASGIAVDAGVGGGVYVDYDGTTIGIVSNKLATLAAFKTVAVPGGSAIAGNGADTLTLTAGTDISISNLGNNVTISSSGSSSLSASKGVQRVTNDFQSQFDSTLKLTGNDLGINLSNANIWSATQTLSGFTGQKLVVVADAGDTAQQIFAVKNSAGVAKAFINELGDLTCQNLQVNGAETVVGILAGSSLTLSSSLTVSGFTDLKGAVTLGDATGDDLTFNGYAASNFIPKTDAFYNLGDPTHSWNYIYAENISNGSGGKTIDVDNIGDISTSQTIGGAWTFTGIPDLPLLFKINNAAVTSNVTAANLNTLVAGSGSNADALHTHASVVSQDVKLIFTASGAVAAGEAVYVIGTSDNTVSLADADSLATARVVGVAESIVSDGATGYVTISGKATISGASFIVGQPVYLSTTAGGLSSVKPTGADKIVFEVGIATSATEVLVAPKMGVSLS